MYYLGNDSRWLIGVVIEIIFFRQSVILKGCIVRRRIIVTIESVAIVAAATTASVVYGKSVVCGEGFVISCSVVYGAFVGIFAQRPSDLSSLFLNLRSSLRQQFYHGIVTTNACPIFWVPELVDNFATLV